MFMRNPIPSCLVLVATLGAWSCNSADPVLGPEVRFGPLSDILGGSIAGSDLVRTTAADFLVGDAASLEEILRFRRQSAESAPQAGLNTILDVSLLDPLARSALGDRLLEPALEPPGPIFLDESGISSTSLRQQRGGIHRVTVGSDRRIHATEELRPPA